MALCAGITVQVDIPSSITLNDEWQPGEIE